MLFRSHKRSIKLWIQSLRYDTGVPPATDKPRILHVWDQAGVSCILAKWLRKAGHYSRVISKSSPEMDPFHFMEFYREFGIPTTDDALFLKIIDKLARDYEIVHVHSLPQLVPRLKKMGKRVVLHYHGTELVTGKYNREGDTLADLVFVATKNLLQYHNRANHLPTPVDTDHFKSLGQKGKGYFTFKIRYLDMSKLQIDFPFTIVDRDTNPLSYAQMPVFFNQWEGYIDIKFDINYGELVHVTSKAGLEALACGLKVYTWERKWTEGLPEENRPENVTRALMRHYQSIL